MYVIDDICYAGVPCDDIRIVSVKALTGHMLLVQFLSGERRLFDATQLSGEAFKPLDDEDVFARVELFHGIPTWANGEIDVAPEFVYKNSVPYEESDILMCAS